MSSFLPALSGNSPIRRLREEARQATTGDTNFVKKSLFFFELRVRDDIGLRAGVVGGRFIFPFVIAPTSYTLGEPFSVQVTPTEQGGLYVEENGIIMRDCRIRGNFGWRPKQFPRDATAPRALLLPTDRSYSRSMTFFVIDALSGMRHFQYLQDAVFRTYGDLKRDPETSDGTQLFLHIPHDEEVWQVVPRKFELTREAQKRVLYDYDIDLLVVGPGQVDFSISEDKPVLDGFKDKLRLAKSFTDMAAGFANDITASLAEVESLIKDVGTVVSSIGQLADATSALVEGIVDVIEAPASIINQLTASIESVTSALVTSVGAVKGISSTYTNSWRRMGDAVNRLGIYPELFETDSQKTLRKIRERQDQDNASRRVEEEGITAPTSIAGFDAIGTSPLPGAADRQRAELRFGRNVNRYSSARLINVAQGDTLAALAATHLGDARLWQDIALFNGMKPPFLDTLGGADLGSPDNPIPGVSGIGADLLIPTFGRPPEQLPLLPVLGVSREESFESQILGTDFLLEPVNERKDQFDWVIDVEHGSQDFKFVTGIANLSQALTTRLTTERGHNPLYKQLGLIRIIGLNQVDVDTETARFRVIESITADPRVAAVSRVSFAASDETPDALLVDADLVVRGFSQGLKVQAIGVE